LKKHIQKLEGKLGILEKENNSLKRIKKLEEEQEIFIVRITVV